MEKLSMARWTSQLMLLIQPRAFQATSAIPSAWETLGPSIPPGQPLKSDSIFGRGRRSLTWCWSASIQSITMTVLLHVRTSTIFLDCYA
jgi:hypothetical protein